MSTLNPARYLGQLLDLGTVEQGKIADLVLLEDDPLVNIRNTRKTAAVVADGKYFAQDALQRLLANITEIASAAE